MSNTVALTVRLSLDVAQLRRSKTALNLVVGAVRGGLLSGRVGVEDLEGLQHLLDAIQDQLALAGVREDLVFDFGEG